jgi:hypothetical protein
MKQIKSVYVSVLLILFLGGTIMAEEAGNRKSLTEASVPRIEFISWAGFAGGTGATINNELFPLAEVSAGIQLKPWFALGAFTSVAPLANFDHAAFGLSIADRDNSYYLAGGTEFLFTPFSENVIHPLFRIAIGGVSIGYLEDNDAVEGFDSNSYERFFFAALSVGMEMNFTRHTSLFARGGARFSGNSEIMGIGKGELSGIEAVIGMRFFWNTVVD